jgi:aryl-alcohol dehydrogenase-like predicted oxidoreductase
MEQRRLGSSDILVPALSFGTGTFGGSGPLFSAWGTSDAAEARRLVDVCIDAGANLFDTADAYSAGASEEILGQAIEGRRSKVLIATKVGLPSDDDVEFGQERMLRLVEASLRRLGTDYVDLLQLHAYDATIPPEELLKWLERLVASGMVRYLGVSNYPAWALMKVLATGTAAGLPSFVAHQVSYSLVDRGYEHELMPLAADQEIGALAWSPLGWGRLTGKLRRGAGYPAGSRLHESASFGPPVDEARLFDILDILARLAEETGRSMPQVALNWLLRRPTVASVIIGARNEMQLRDNLGAVGWSLTAEQVARLDQVSDATPPYPHWLYRQPTFARLNPPIV